VLSWPNRPNISLKKQAQHAHPVLKKNGTKNGISQLKSGYRKYGRTNALSFSVPFPFIPKKIKTDGKKWYTVADETGFIPSVFILGYDLL
jgi:hypothetical protein